VRYTSPPRDLGRDRPPVRSGSRLDLELPGSFATLSDMRRTPGGFKVGIVVLLAGSVLLAGCGGKTDDVARFDPMAQTSDATTTSTTVDPYAVPAVIDAAYVERVLNALDKVRADVRNHIMDTKQYSPEDDARIRATYSSTQVARVVDEMRDASIVGIPTIRPGSGPSVLTVTKLRFANSSCISAEVTVDERPNQLRPSAPLSAVFILRAEAHDKTLNPTPYMRARATLPQYLNAEDECP
jgi:hypothetical protein